MKKPQILKNDKGYYIFQFESIEDRDLVMQAGLYTFFNKTFYIAKLDYRF